MTAFIFVPLLAMTMIGLFFLVTYISRCLLVVVEETAAGNDVVEWPVEPFTDWIWQGWYVTFLASVWVAPALLVALIVAPLFPAQEQDLWFVLIAAGTFWFMFPISLMSSMSAESRWAVLHGSLIVRVALRPRSVLAFYVASFVVVVIGAVCLYALLLRDGTLTLIVCPIGIAACILLYGRLTGRLGLLLKFTHVPIRKKKRRSRRTRGVEVADPWEMPTDLRPEGERPRQPREMAPLNTPDPEARTGYGVRFDDDPPASPVEKPPAANLESALVNNMAPPIDDVARRAAMNVKPDEVEMRRGLQKRVRPPKSPWTEGIVTYLFYPATLVPFTLLTLGIGTFGLLVRLLRALNPS
jgi:hypothetical protein